MPFKTILNRLRAAKAMGDTKVAKAPAILDDPFAPKETISKTETAAILQGILEDEQMQHPTQRIQEDSLH